MLEAININHLMQREFVQTTTSWANDLCKKLQHLPLTPMTWFVQEADHSIIFRITSSALQAIEMKAGKKRHLDFQRNKALMTLNGRIAQKDDLKTVLMMIKTGILIGKKTGFFSTPSQDTLSDLMATLNETNTVPNAQNTPEALRNLALLGKAIHTHQDQTPSLIGTFFEKTKQLFLGIKNGLNRLIIKNDIQKPKPSLRYALSIEEIAGRYVEKSHFVSNTVQVDFNKETITINEQPITPNGCTWFSDRLGHLCQDLAGGRAEMYEG